MNIIKPKIYEIEEIGNLKVEIQENLEKYEICEKRFKEEEENIDADKYTFRNCIFESCRLSHSHFENAYFCDVIFQNCDFSNSDFSKAGFNRVEFINCKLIGCEFIESDIFNTYIKESNFAYVNFSEANFKDVKMENSNLQNSSINEVTWKNIIFLECDLNRAELVRTKLQGIDFSTCEFNGITVNIPDLKGIIVNEFQALELSKLLGLKIK